MVFYRTSMIFFFFLMIVELGFFRILFANDCGLHCLTCIYHELLFLFPFFISIFIFLCLFVCSLCLGVLGVLVSLVRFA
ncbi:hypothetical protein B9Z19DRAFT_1095477 [Tuber borchii]|uniref:Uncharacterized protein n=1 Tax=Tuber borchii TaxID=42251 RepID=A0A2T6ZCP4_TUBBO|nr:hypothetical protein B9Z19DRAFT_1095477 [Tuber borchii]